MNTDFESFLDYWAHYSRWLRYGQAYCNYHNISNPELYYEKRIDKTLEMISNLED